MKTFKREVIDLTTIDETKRDEKKSYIDYSKIIKLCINNIEDTIGRCIISCSKRKWLDKRFSIEKQEKDLLFELELYKDYFTHAITSLIPYTKVENIICKISTSAGSGEGNKIKTTELITVIIKIQCTQSTLINNKQEYELEFNYSLKLESEVGWH